MYQSIKSICINANCLCSSKIPHMYLHNCINNVMRLMFYIQNILNIELLNDSLNMKLNMKVGILEIHSFNQFVQNGRSVQECDLVPIDATERCAKNIKSSILVCSYECVLNQ